MTRILEYGRKGPAKGQGRQVVVFLHGYGADGNDLLGLAEPLAPHMPGTVFIAPNAPERCVNNPMGYQWFPVPWLDGSSQEAAASSMQASAADLDAFLDDVLAEEGLSADRMILFGFSQGTMMALHVAPRRPAPVAGVVGFSGRLLGHEHLAEEARVKPPVLLIHGDQDEVVPPSSLPEAANALQAAGFDVYAHVMKGTGHGIAPDGLSVALAFMREKLGLG
jgi:phospholipase/carboxylesterase